MPKSIQLHVWGDHACFTRPEMKVERVSYDVITPSAARGILEAIYWKPQMRWVIERLHVLRPIRFTNIRRNEVGSKASAANARKAMKSGTGNLGLFVEEQRQQRAGTILRDVAYGIEARVELIDDSDPAEKHYQMFRRRAERGQCFHRPYFGCREFPVDFAFVDGQFPPTELRDEDQDRDLGYMLLDMAYAPGEKKDFQVIEAHQGKKLKAEPRFFRAEMKAGIITVPPVYADEVTA